MDFKDRLRQLREEHGITQKDCAKELGVEYANYNKWENGKSPNFETICVIADYFNVSTDYLLGRSVAKNPENEDISKRIGLTDGAVYVLEEIKQNVILKNYDEYYQTLSALLEDNDFLEALKMIHHLRFGSFERDAPADGAIRSTEAYAVDDEKSYRGARWEIENLINRAIDKIHGASFEHLSER